MNDNSELAARIRGALKDTAGIEEKKMFGGIAFMHRGNMCCGPAKGELMVRVGEEQAARAVETPHARICDFTGRPMKSMLLISPEGIADDAALRAWIDMALRFTGSLPAK